MSIDEKISRSAFNQKMLAVLVDPDKNDLHSLRSIAEYSVKSKVDFFLVGGSIVYSPIEDTINCLKEYSSIPVVIFPGNSLQISDKADCMLFISLISGRNPEFLIGHHVLAAPQIKRAGIKTIPTGYILIENGRTTSVEYMSNTVPIPADKPEIVVATAMAGEMLGLSAIYLEAGSGASNMVGLNLISEVRENTSIPLIVGGGIKSGKDAAAVYKAGADIVVTGTAVENNPAIIPEFARACSNY